MLRDFERADRIREFWGNPGIRVERGEAQCLRLPRRSFQDEVDDRERSDYYGDDDDDPDADGSDHPTTPRHHKPPTRLCETLLAAWSGEGSSIWKATRPCCFRWLISTRGGARTTRESRGHPQGHHLTSMSKKIEVLRSASVISGEETR
jgi:hypothetical protein